MDSIVVSAIIIIVVAIGKIIIEFVRGRKKARNSPKKNWDWEVIFRIRRRDHSSKKKPRPIDFSDIL